MIRKRHLLPAALAATSFGVCLPAAAHDNDACQPFTVVSDGSDRTVEYVDVGANGPSPGDQRIGYRSLADLDGNPVGHYRWVVTVLDLPGEDGTGGESYYDYVMALNDGDVSYHRLVRTANSVEDTNDISWDTTQSAIISGGTGAYAFAEGTVTISRDGMTVTNNFDISCER